MPTFYVEPSPKRGEITQGVIAKIIGHHQRLLPEFGWTETDDWQEADLSVGHLGAKAPRLDVFHLHGLYPTGTMKLPRGCWEANETIIDNLRRTRHIVAVSDWVAEMVRRDMRIDPFVLGHGIDLEPWGKYRRSRAPFAQGKYVLWNKTRTLGVCDPTPVLELAHALPDVKFLTTFLPDGAKTPPNVHVTGLLPEEDMWRIVKGAAVYLATTRETFGVGILEAMASGVPVVGYGWGAAPDVLAGTGWLVTPGDNSALVEAVQEALTGDERKAMTAAAMERVQEYDWRLVVERLAQLYEACLPQPHDGPLISVVIPCYNYSQYVGQAIASVLAQTVDDIELIVVDDGSTDKSAERIQEAIADDSRARLIQQENTGVAEARNHGIREARGRYIACLDADDMMAPRFLETCLEPLQQDPRLAIAYTALGLIGADDQPLNAKADWPWAYDRSKGLEVNQVPTCCLFRKEWWQRCGGYKSRFLSGRGAGQEDGDLWFNILAHGGGAVRASAERLFLYRFHPLQATRNFKDYWKRTIYEQWYPWVMTKERHPFASQLVLPEKASLPVYDYDGPHVSIVMPVGPYHRRAFVDAVDSVLSQTYRRWQLVIVNDSGDPLDTSAWPCAKVVETDMPGMGPGYARNLGMTYVTTPLVVFLDADDILQATFLEETLPVWQETGGWVYTDFYYIAADGSHRVHETPDWSSEKLWNKGIAAVTAVYPVEAFQAVGGFDEEIQHEDWEFHIKLTVAGWCGTRLASPLVTYRHDTGKRREEGIEAKGFIDIKKRYSREGLMGCNCGRGGGRRTRVKRATSNIPATAPPRTQAPPPAPMPGAADGGNGYILMHYVGKSDTDLLFRGRKYQYVFSTQRPWAWVHPLDVNRLASRSVLQRFDATKQGQTGEPMLLVPRGG